MSGFPRCPYNPRQWIINFENGQLCKRKEQNFRIIPEVSMVGHLRTRLDQGRDVSQDSLEAFESQTCQVL